MKIQKANDGEWLYEDRANDERYFAQVVYMPDNGEDWLSCTDAEKEAWEAEHLPDDEPQDAEVVE